MCYGGSAGAVHVFFALVSFFALLLICSNGIMHITKRRTPVDLSRLRQRVDRLDKERRAHIRQLLHAQEMIQGSLYQMERRCGKPGCRCVEGEKHVSWYLSRALGGRTKLTYIGRIVPAWIEVRIKRHQRYHRLLARIRMIDTAISDCLNRLRDERTKTIEKALKERK